MSQVTVRNLDPATEHSLRSLARQRKQSLSTVTLSLVRQSLGTEPRSITDTQQYRDFSEFCGLWTAEEAAAFDAVLAEQSQVDPGDWK